MEAFELSHLGEIDRTEHITTIFVQRGAELEEQEAEFNVPPWSVEGEHDHTLDRQRDSCERYLASGGTALGAFDDDRLVGIGIVAPHIRPGVAQLAFLHVSNGYRGRGVGRRLAEELERLAVKAGDRQMVVSATPSVNTVRFYMVLGYTPMAEPMPELYDLEPEDVHLSKALPD